MSCCVLQRLAGAVWVVAPCWRAAPLLWWGREYTHFLHLPAQWIYRWHFAVKLPKVRESKMEDMDDGQNNGKLQLLLVRLFPYVKKWTGWMNWRVLAGQTPSADEVDVIYFSRACGESDSPNINKNICTFTALFLKRRLSQADLNLWNYCCEINGAHSASKLLWKMITDHNLNHLLINTIL